MKARSPHQAGGSLCSFNGCNQFLKSSMMPGHIVRLKVMDSNKKNKEFEDKAICMPHIESQLIDKLKQYGQFLDDALEAKLAGGIVVSHAGPLQSPKDIVAAIISALIACGDIEVVGFTGSKGERFEIPLTLLSSDLKKAKINIMDESVVQALKNIPVNGHIPELRQKLRSKKYREIVSFIKRKMNAVIEAEIKIKEIS